MRAMETEGASARSPEATGKCPDIRETRHMDAAARDGNVTEMLTKIRASLLEGANGVDNNASAVSEIGAFFWAYLQLVQSHPGIFRLLRSSEMRRRPSRVQIRIEHEGFHEWIRQAIATGVRNGSIRDDLDPRPLALILAGMLGGLRPRAGCSAIAQVPWRSPRRQRGTPSESSSRRAQVAGEREPPRRRACTEPRCGSAGACAASQGGQTESSPGPVPHARVCMNAQREPSPKTGDPKDTL